MLEFLKSKEFIKTDQYKYRFRVVVKTKHAGEFYWSSNLYNDVIKIQEDSQKIIKELTIILNTTKNEEYVTLCEICSKKEDILSLYIDDIQRCVINSNNTVSKFETIVLHDNKIYKVNE